jgi:hypothetical protein
MFDVLSTNDSYLNRLIFTVGALIITVLVSGILKKTITAQQGK